MGSTVFPNNGTQLQMILGENISKNRYMTHNALLVFTKNTARLDRFSRQLPELCSTSINCTKTTFLKGVVKCIIRDCSRFACGRRRVKSTESETRMTT